MSLDERSCTRRDLFRTVLGELASAAEETARGCAEPLREAFAPPARQKPFVRPPGALTEELFLQTCTRCDDCVKACPEWVIRKAGPELGPRQEGYPLILPAENPCLFCEGLPCIAACKTGALLPPLDGGPARIGLASVNRELCYLAQGQPCDYCAKECPVRPRAITLPGPGKEPRVDALSCTGCGECAQICPANAVTIEALR